MTDLPELARRLAARPRRVDVDLDDGEVPDVPLLDHHIMPSVGNAVWIVRVRPGGWLYGGKQG